MACRCSASVAAPLAADRRVRIPDVVPACASIRPEELRRSWSRRTRAAPASIRSRRRAEGRSRRPSISGWRRVFRSRCGAGRDRQKFPRSASPWVRRHVGISTCSRRATNCGCRRYGRVGRSATRAATTSTSTTASTPPTATPRTGSPVFRKRLGGGQDYDCVWTYAKRCKPLAIPLPRRRRSCISGPRSSWLTGRLLRGRLFERRDQSHSGAIALGSTHAGMGMTSLPSDDRDGRRRMEPRAAISASASGSAGRYARRDEPAPSGLAYHQPGGYRHERLRLFSFRRYLVRGKLRMAAPSGPEFALRSRAAWKHAVPALYARSASRHRRPLDFWFRRSTDFDVLHPPRAGLPGFARQPSACSGRPSAQRTRDPHRYRDAQPDAPAIAYGLGGQAIVSRTRRPAGARGSWRRRAGEAIEEAAQGTPESVHLECHGRHQRDRSSGPYTISKRGAAQAAIVLKAATPNPGDVRQGALAGEGGAPGERCVRPERLRAQRRAVVPGISATRVRSRHARQPVARRGAVTRRPCAFDQLDDAPTKLATTRGLLRRSDAAAARTCPYREADRAAADVALSLVGGQRRQDDDDPKTPPADARFRCWLQRVLLSHSRVVDRMQISRSRRRIRRLDAPPPARWRPARQGRASLSDATLTISGEARTISRLQFRARRPIIAGWPGSWRRPTSRRRPSRPSPGRRDRTGGNDHARRLRSPRRSACCHPRHCLKGRQFRDRRPAMRRVARGAPADSSRARRAS